MNYRAYGITLSSSLPLPELIPTTDQHTVLGVSVSSESVDRAEWTWRERRAEGDHGPRLAVGVLGGACLLAFDGGVDFHVAADARAIVCHPQPGVPVSTLRHVLVDQVIPLVLSRLDRLVLHASAFVAPGGAVALLGAAGAGKSTLAASFGSRGAAVIADDAVVLNREAGEVIVTPAYPGVRVWPDVLSALGVGDESATVAHYTDKRRLGVGRQGFTFAANPVVLRRVYLLDEASKGTRIVPLSRRDALIELIKHSFILDFADRASMGDQFARVSRECASVDVRRVAYPRDLSVLASVRTAILEDLDAG